MYFCDFLSLYGYDVCVEVLKLDENVFTKWHFALNAPFAILFELPLRDDIRLFAPVVSVAMVVLHCPLAYFRTNLGLNMYGCI